VGAALVAGVWWQWGGGGPTGPPLLATAEEGALEEVVHVVARSRYADVYRLRADVAGMMGRITLQPGDALAVDSVWAEVTPPLAALLDGRSREQLEVQLAAARQGVLSAQAAQELARGQLRFAEGERDRVSGLRERGMGTEQAVTAADQTVALRQAEVRQAGIQLRVARHQVEQLEAQLAPADAAVGGPAPVQLRTPVAGTVLQVHRRDAGLVAPGEVVMDLGVAEPLEVVAEVLTRDAQRIGAEARLRVDAGGEAPLMLPIVRVEPRAFTRVSALGVEEQRVHVVAAWPSPAERPPGIAALGDAWELDAQLVLWQGRTLQVPLSALSRRGEAWVVQRWTEDRVEEAVIRIGRRGEESVEVVDGLSAGTQVVRYPVTR
jgi:HlyD family secretion protein